MFAWNIEGTADGQSSKDFGTEYDSGPFSLARDNEAAGQAGAKKTFWGRDEEGNEDSGDDTDDSFDPNDMQLEEFDGLDAALAEPAVKPEKERGVNIGVPLAKQAAAARVSEAPRGKTTKLRSQDNAKVNGSVSKRNIPFDAPLAREAVFSEWRQAAKAKGAKVATLQLKERAQIAARVFIECCRSRILDDDDDLFTRDETGALVYKRVDRTRGIRKIRGSTATQQASHVLRAVEDVGLDAVLKGPEHPEVAAHFKRRAENSIKKATQRNGIAVQSAHLLAKNYIRAVKTFAARSEETGVFDTPAFML